MVIGVCVGVLRVYFFYFSVLAGRWEEERYTDGMKWKFLEHKGPVFAPPYEPVPSNVKFYYDGKTLRFLCSVFCFN